MKKSILTLILSLSISMLKSQSVGLLQSNNVRARINSNGSLFTDILNRHGKFEVPRGTEKNLIFSANIWLSGVDVATNDIYSSAYPFFDYELFTFGPIANSYDASYIKTYNKVWVVDKATIESHRYGWNSPGYVMPNSIKSWPGNGNVSNGEARFLAPFADRNNNGIYEPEKGDYPCVPGDEATFIIFNDVAGRDTTFGKAMGLEIHLIAYQFKDLGAINNTVFLNYKVINRSNRNYKDFRMGFFADMDLGCPTDDYIGCDSSLNTFFGYNGDTLDDKVCLTTIGIPGFAYGNQTPAVGFTFLNRPLHGFMRFHYGTGALGFPTTSAGQHNMLNAQWGDGTHLTYGGIGYGGTVNTNYLFPTNPNDTTAGGWNEFVAGNPPGDRLGIGVVEQTKLNNANSFVKFDLAVFYSQELDRTEMFRSINKLKRDVPVIKSYYDNLIENCETIVGIEDELSQNALKIYPNPVNDLLYLSNNNLTPELVNVYDLLGNKLKVSSAGIRTIDVSDLANGVYLISIDWGSEVTLNRVVVNH